MHVFFVSLVTFFLSPLRWIIILILTAIFLRRRKIAKPLWITAIILFFIFSNGRLLDQFARRFQPAPLTLEPGAVYSCGIVAGGFASPVKDGTGTFNSSADRFIQALRLFKLKHITHILVSGGNGKKEKSTFREAAWVKNELIIMGVPDSAILIEDRSGNTKENAANAKQILSARQLPPPYLLISSAHHLPRASLLFKQAGVQVIPFPCNYIAGRGVSTAADWIPDAAVLQTWDVFLKEWLGTWWYK